MQTRKTKKTKLILDGWLEVKIGDKIEIIDMEGEPNYKGRIGKVEFIDDANQIHGTWGSLALNADVDCFRILK